MNKGPMSRIQKVPVKCKNCGRIKHNVVYREVKQESKPPEKEKIKEKPAEKLPPIRPQTHYINDILANQRRLAEKYNIDQ